MVTSSDMAHMGATRVKAVMKEWKYEGTSGHLKDTREGLSEEQLYWANALGDAHVGTKIKQGSHTITAPYCYSLQVISRPKTAF